MEIAGGTRYRSVLYTVDWQNAATELTVELTPVSGWEGFLQAFRPAARGGRGSE